MKVIEIGGRSWQKFVGDEGQDVYVALFLESEDKLLGKYVDENSYDILIDRDADFYFPPERDMFGGALNNEEHIGSLDESRVAFKFRKNVFTKEEQIGAFEGLYDAAVESNNRGLAAGPRSDDGAGKRDWVTPFQEDILSYYENHQPQSVMGCDAIQEIIEKHKNATQSTRGSVWLRAKVEGEFGDYKGFFPQVMEMLEKMEVSEAAKYAKTLRTDYVSATSYAQPLWSGIAGFYGRYPRIPYGRATAYVDHNREKFEKCYPFARKLDSEFSRLLPERYAKQKAFSDRLDDKFLIGEDTSFTTITVNTTSKDRNARMACHRDAGSLNEGFSNLTVVTKDDKDWEGGYLVAPEARVAIDVRPGDLLLIDNMRVIHGNTPIKPPSSGEDDMLRMSLVFYFREDMDNLGSWDYENLRRQFVDDRRKNEDHELWKPFWNGVSPSMWSTQEWYDYLESHGGKDMVQEYHPEAYSTKSTLEGFF